jgi:hypothetical protein
MLFDVRLPIGLLFLAMGLLVGGYGVLGHPAPSAGVNIDLVWGAVMGVFGVVMLALAVISKGRAAAPPPPEDRIGN